MQAHEIPAEQWVPFLQGFTHEHRGQRVQVESEWMEAVHAHAFDLPLVDIRIESGSGSPPPIEVVVGERPEERICHRVFRPTHLRLADDESGQPAIKIAAADSSVTVIRFGPATAADPAGFGSS